MQAAEAGRRAAVRPLPLDHPVRIAKVDDQLEHSVGEVPLAREGRLPLEIPEAIDEARQVRWAPPALRPASQRTVEMPGDDAHDGRLYSSRKCRESGLPRLRQGGNAASKAFRTATTFKGEPPPESPAAAAPALCRGLPRRRGPGGGGGGRRRRRLAPGPAGRPRPGRGRAGAAPRNRPASASRILRSGPTPCRAGPLSPGPGPGA